MECYCNLLDGLHDGQILLPEAKRDRALGGTGEALEKLDQLAVLELQRRTGSLVLAEEMQGRRLEGVAPERHTEGPAEGE